MAEQTRQAHDDTLSDKTREALRSALVLFNEERAAERLSLFGDELNDARDITHSALRIVEKGRMRAGRQQLGD